MKRKVSGSSVTKWVMKVISDVLSGC
jgi:hypothetical protein